MTTWPSVAEFLKRKVAQYQDRTLLLQCGGDWRCTYRQFDALTDRLASGFRRLGLGAGGRVVFLHPNHVDLLLGGFAVVKAGGVAVPINPAYTAREAAHIIDDCSASVLIGTSELGSVIDSVRARCPSLRHCVVKSARQSLEAAMQAAAGPLEAGQPAAADADDTAMLFYTSGTTGKPKGVIITHRNITFGAGNMAQNYGLTPADRAVICLPLNHIFANASPFWGSLASGGSAVVLERFQTDLVFEAISSYRPTWFAGVPTMYTYLLSAYDPKIHDVSSLRMGLSGGASLSVEHLTDFEARFGVNLIEVYGLTESTGLVTANPIHGIRKPGSIGIQVSGVSVRLVNETGSEASAGEVGELIFKGPNGTPGYWQLPEETAAKIRAGWIATGDLAYQDAEGYYFISGRKSELIISGGYNIFPREIEEVLYQHPDVLEAAVIGVADPARGEVPKAFVVLKPQKQLSRESLEAFCRNRLARYKIPKEFVFLDSLPKNTTGKIMKSELA